MKEVYVQKRIGRDIIDIDEINEEISKQHKLSNS